MTRLLVALTLSVAAVLLPVPEAMSAEQTSTSTPVNAFGADLYRSISAGNENVFYSAYSIHSALAMTLAGAKGQTAEQMQKVLHTEGLDAGESFRFLSGHLKKVRDQHGFELNIANSIWGEQSVQFRDAFTTMLKDRYGSEVMKVDFRNAAEAARSRINAWVSEQTKEKIPDLIPAGMLDRMTRLVLVNAIYFKAAWQSPFEKSATEDSEFRLHGGLTTTVRMMNQSLRTRYAEEEGLQILELPYKGGANSMLILLPRGDDISAAEQMLVPDELQRITSTLRARQVQVALPSFKMRFKIDLSRQLAGMGMALAFSDKADFTGMTEEEPIQISNVVHEAFVAVDEAGTEAAAATAVMMRTTAMPMPEEAVIFKADHPFVFAIRDHESGVVLFAGRLMKPEAK